MYVFIQQHSKAFREAEDNAHNCSTDIRTQSVRTHHTKPTPVTLATYTLARPVQTVLLYTNTNTNTIKTYKAPLYKTGQERYKSTVSGYMHEQKVQFSV